MFLKVSDIRFNGYIYKQLNGKVKKGNHKDVLEKYILNLLEPREKTGELAKMVSFLGPELRAEAKKNPGQTEKVRTLISKFWPELSCKVEGADHHSYDENVNILRTLHQQRAFYLLEEMRVKLGNELFNNLLQEATEYDFDSLELLAYAQEDQLLTSYLQCWDAKYPDLIHRLNNEEYLHKLAYHNCMSGIQAIVQIAKRQSSPESFSQGISTSTVLMQALKPDEAGLTPVHFAASSGNVEAVRAVGELLTNAAQKEQSLKPDNCGCTPLHLAAMSGNIEAVRAVWELLTTSSQKEQALIQDKDGCTPLYLAANSGNVETVRAMWELLTTAAQKEQSLKPDKYGWTPLHLAASSGNVEMLLAVWELLTTEALKEQVLKPNWVGRMPLHYAAQSRNAEAVRAVWKLLTTAALKEQSLKPDRNGYTPMHCAAMSGNAKTLQAVWVLLTTAAQKEQALKPNWASRTPLHLAAKSGNAKAVLAVWELLTTATQKKQALKPDKYGLTPLYFAARSGNAETLRAVGELYTASDLLVVIRDKRPNSKLHEYNLETLLAIYPDASQEKRLIESELHLRRGEKKELSEKWEAWLEDSKECRTELLPLVLLNHDEMAEILIESLGDVLKKAVQRVLNQNISQEKKLLFLPFLPPDLVRSTVDQAREQLLVRAKEHPVVIEGFRGSAQKALILMRTQWANHLRGDPAPVLFAYLQKGLAAFPSITLAALARYPEMAVHLIRCLKACSDRQLSVVIPQLKDELFREAMRHYTVLRLHLLEKATKEQKQIYLREFEKDLGYQEWRKSYEGLESQNHTFESLSNLLEKARILQAKISWLKNKIYTSEHYVKERTRWQESLEKLEKGIEAIQAAYNRTAALESKNIPEEFVCPLSGEIMKDPVQLPSGKVVDRASIERWLESSQTDPFTREDLTSEMLKPDSDLKEKIAPWNNGSGKPGSNSE